MRTRNPAATGFQEEERNFYGYYIHTILYILYRYLLNSYKSIKCFNTFQ